MKNQRDLALSLAWLVPFLVYAFSCYHHVGFWDVGEMDTVPWILGIPHPTGFPAFVLVGWIFTHVVALGTVAYRMSLLSAFSLSITAWLIARIIDEESHQPWVATACAWVFAFGDITWARATRAEVHAFAALAIALTLYCAVRWHRTQDGRFFIGGAIAWAIGIAVHPVAALLFPGLLLWCVLGIWQKRIGWRVLVTSCLVFCVIIGGCYAYLPLRSAYVTAHRLDPTITLGLPPGEAFWDYDHPATRDGFRQLVSGSDFDVRGGLQAMFASETYADAGLFYLNAVGKEFTAIGIALALLGIIFGFIQKPWLTGGLLLCGCTSVAFALGYYEEADSKRYFLTSLVIGAVFIGSGADWFIKQWRPLKSIAPVVLTAIAAWLLYSGHGFFRQPHDDRAEAPIRNVLRATPSDAIVIAPWSYATPLAYAAYVEHALQQRTLVAAWIHEKAAYVPQWAARRPVYVVDTIDVPIPGYRYEIVAKHPAVYRVVKR